MFVEGRVVDSRRGRPGAFRVAFQRLGVFQANRPFQPLAHCLPRLGFRVARPEVVKITEKVDQALRLLLLFRNGQQGEGLYVLKHVETVHCPHHHILRFLAQGRSELNRIL